MSHLDRCVQEHCTASQDPICSVLVNKTSGSLFGAKSSSCDHMVQMDINTLRGETCTKIIQDAKLLASGKADFPCPPYFPWCNDVAPSNAFFHVNVLASDAKGATLEVLVGDVVSTTRLHDGEAFQSLSLMGAGSLTEPGRPAVPTLSFYVGVPATTDEVRVASLKRDEISDINKIKLSPYVRPSLEDEGQKPFVVDSDFYKQDIDVPGVESRVDAVSTWRNYRVARVTVYPFQYNPKKERLSAARRVTLRLSFLDTKPGPDDTVKDGEAVNSGAYSGALVNYPETYRGPSPSDDPNRVRYLIIAHDPLIKAIQPLVDLKKTQGYAPKVLKLSEVGAEPQKIKDAIIKEYRASAIEYVLLVGDVDDLPFYTYELPWTSFYPKGDILGDYWYSLLAGDDLLPEVSVGRIAGKTPKDVAVHVAKTVAYETADPMAAWRKKILLVAHGQQYPHKYTACAEEVRTHEYRAGPVEFTKLYGGEHATNDDIVGEVNKGLGLIAYRGHGLPNSWFYWNGEDFIASEQKLENAAMTPVVFSVACLNLSMQEKEVTLGEQWVQLPGGGAVGFLGSAMKSWSPPNDVLMKKLFEGILDDGVTTVGPLINRARVEMIKKYTPDDSGPDNAMMYLWLGDPSLHVGQSYQVKARAHVQWCKVSQVQGDLGVATGKATPPIYGQVWAGGVTEELGQGAGIEAAVGFGPAGTDPSDAAWTWTSAKYVADKGSNDEYGASLTLSSAGVYAYALRFKGADDKAWTYCDQDGSQNGLSTEKLGTVMAQ